MSQKDVNKALFTVADATTFGIALYYLYALRNTPNMSFTRLLVCVLRSTHHQ